MVLWGNDGQSYAKYVAIYFISRRLTITEAKVIKFNLYEVGHNSHGFEVSKMI